MSIRSLLAAATVLVVAVLGAACSSKETPRAATMTTDAAATTTSASGPDTAFCRTGAQYAKWRAKNAGGVTGAEPPELARLFSESADWMNQLAAVTPDAELSGQLRLSASARADLATQLGQAKSKADANAVLDLAPADADIVNGPPADVEDELAATCRIQFPGGSN
ncbi:MAG: hypothetical protein ACOYNI_08835 [Acidimicrobiia bacterium]